MQITTATVSLLADPREPTAIEERLMVYLAFIHGASGIMAFSHANQDQTMATSDPGANAHLRFPSSTNLWNEYQRLTFEAVEFTLGLLSDRHAADRPTVAVSNASLHAVALMETRPNTGGSSSSSSSSSSVVVLVANTANEPMMMELTLGGGHSYDDHAVVLFHHRNCSVAPAAAAAAAAAATAATTATTAGDVVLSDMIEALSTKAYRVFLKTKGRSAPAGTTKAEVAVAPTVVPTITVNPKNELLNPSFGEFDCCMLHCSQYCSQQLTYHLHVIVCMYVCMTMYVCMSLM